MSVFQELYNKVLAKELLEKFLSKLCVCAYNGNVNYTESPTGSNL